MNTQKIGKVIGYPFAKHVCQNSRPEINNVHEFLKNTYKPYYTNNDNLLRYGVYRLMGYEYCFKEFLKKYLYKQYGNWYEAYAPNKTILRKVTYGKIDDIIELK
jgi:hypothetical protein